MDVEKIRNVGIVAHIDAGKTTTTERILFYTGKNYKIGEVDQGAATMDWMSQEQERGITITAAATTCNWTKDDVDYQINIIDTPGHVDFTLEVERSLRVLDGAVVVVCGVSGVQAQTETVWAQANKFTVPRLVFINKLDRRGADFEQVVHKLQEKFSITPLMITVPYIVNEELQGVINVLDQKLLLYSDDHSFGREYSVQEIPADLAPKMAKSYQDLLEKAAEFDDELIENYLAGKKIDKSLLIRAIKKAALSLKAVPVFAGSSFKNKGVQSMIDGLVHFMPNPKETPPIFAKDTSGNSIEVQHNFDDDPLALLFKVQVDPFAGLLFFIRVYRGCLEAGKTYWNNAHQKRERILKLYRIHSNQKVEVDKVHAGDIAAAVGLKFSRTGNTFTVKENALSLEPIFVPRPVIATAIELKQKSDTQKFGEYLERLLCEDPSLQVKQDAETGQTVLYGMGELHLEVAIERVKREANIGLNIGKQQVSLREKVSQKTFGTEIFERPILGKATFAKVELFLTPIAQEKNEIKIDPQLEKKLKNFPEILSEITFAANEALFSGVLGGYPVIQTQVVVTEVDFPPQDWHIAAIKVAAAGALRKALLGGQCVLLTPFMNIVVEAPTEFLGAVTSDLNMRNVKIQGVLDKNELVSVQGEGPLEKMLGYTTKLRSLTRGKGVFSMEFCHFAPKE